MGSQLLRIQSLKVEFRSYRGVVKALDGVDLAVEAGEILGLVGESGCGKTITGMSILGLLPRPQAHITSGRIVFKGNDLLGLSDKELTRIRGRQISMVFQDPLAALNPVFSVREQISCVIREHGSASKKDAYERTKGALAAAGLPTDESILNSYPHQLSGGMRQRVCMAMALSCDSQLLIADEPTTALDVAIQMQILRLLVSLREELGVAQILITHNLGVAAQTCDRIAVMYAGQVVEQGPTVDVVKRPLHPYTAALYACLPGGKRVRGLSTIPGSVPDLIDPPAGCRFHPRCSHALDICREVKPAFAEKGPTHAVACHWVAADNGDGQGARHP